MWTKTTNGELADVSNALRDGATKQEYADEFVAADDDMWNRVCGCYSVR